MWMRQVSDDSQLTTAQRSARPTASLSIAGPSGAPWLTEKPQEAGRWVMRTGSSVREEQHQNFTVWYWRLCKDTECFGSSSFGLLNSPNVWFRDITSPSVSLHPQWKMLPLQCRRLRCRIEHKSWNLDYVLSFSKPWHEVNIISMLFTTPTEDLTTLKEPLSSWMKAPRFSERCHPGWLWFFKIMFVLQLLTRICV